MGAADNDPGAGAAPLRHIPLLPILVLLAGCGGGGPAPLPTGRISAYFPAGGVVDAIDIDALDRLPLRTADLVAPDGRTIPAGPIVARPAPSNGVSLARPTGGMPVLGGSGGNPPGPVGAAVGTESTLLATLSTATIALPDPIAYRRDWRRYRIRLRFGDPPSIENREIAAPAPPPAVAAPFAQ